MSENNPLLEKRRRSLPGVTFRMPSRGEIYKPGVLSDDVKDGEVVVYPMRLREELKMKSLDSIFQGSAVSETISYSVPQVLLPEKLCPTDIDYLMTAIKKQTHGEEFTYKDVCMKIEHLVDRTTILEDSVESEFEEMDRPIRPDDSLDSIGEKLKSFDKVGSGDVTDDEDGVEEKQEFDPVLDNKNNMGENSKFCQFIIPLSHFMNTAKELNPDEYEEKKRLTFRTFGVEIKQINFLDYKEISNLRLKDDPNKMGEEAYYEYINKFSNVNIARRIQSVDNIDDPVLIEEWVDSLSLEERTELFTEISKAFEWGIDFDYTLACETCGKTKDIDMSYINPLYFFLTS